MTLKSAFPGNLEGQLAGVPSDGPGLGDAIQQDARWRILDWLAASVVATHETQASYFSDFSVSMNGACFHITCSWEVL